MEEVNRGGELRRSGNYCESVERLPALAESEQEQFQRDKVHGYSHTWRQLHVDQHFSLALRSRPLWVWRLRAWLKNFWQSGKFELSALRNAIKEWRSRPRQFTVEARVVPDETLKKLVRDIVNESQEKAKDDPR